MPSGLVRVLGGGLASQSLLLMVMQALSMMLSFTLTYLVSRGLGVEVYGSFRYAMTFLALAMTVLQFGGPYSAARMLALENDPAVQRQIVGACAVIVVRSSIVGTLLTLTILVSAESLGYHPPGVLWWVAFVPYVTLGQYMIGSICQGTGRISLLSVQQVFPYFLLLPFTALQIYVFRYYTLGVAIAAYVVAFTVTIAVGFIRLGVTFTNWRHWLRGVARENRRTGLPIYFGGLFGTASVQVIALWVAEYVEPSRYGQFALAAVVASPMGVLISSIGTVIFRSSSSRASLSRRVLVVSFALGGGLGVTYLAATETLLVPVFGAQFGPSVRMAQVMGLSSLMIGWGDIFQRFLGAQGRGRRLALVSVSTGTAGMVSAAWLLPRWNAYGAITSSLLAAATYLGLMLVSYRHHTSRAPANVEAE